MELQNGIGFETRHGYRSIELHHGDICETAASSDLLVVSSIAGSYIPTSSSVMGALHRTWGIDLRHLDKEIDLRTGLGLWVSAPLGVSHFGRLMCVDLPVVDDRLSSTLQNVFLGLALIDAKGLGARTITMPLLGAGEFRLDPEQVLSSLVPAVRQALEHSYSLERVLFVEKNKQRVDTFSEALNRLLDRPRIVLSGRKLLVDLRADLCLLLDKLIAQNSGPRADTLRDLRSLLARKNARSYEIGLLARRLAERVVEDILGTSQTQEPLAVRIGRLREKSIAAWLQSYLHTMRHMGNEAAHERSDGDQFPAFVTEDDLTICLLCIQRVLGFWHDYRGRVSNGGTESATR
jgi:O-acetyl-ADP-ribose deacetylase (regulator of RNase III)